MAMRAIRPFQIRCVDAGERATRLWLARLGRQKEDAGESVKTVKRKIGRQRKDVDFGLGAGQEEKF